MLLQKIAERWTMDANGFSVVDNRASITFGVELYVPWDDPHPYGRTSRVWDSLFAMKSGCAGGRGLAPQPGQ